MLDDTKLITSTLLHIDLSLFTPQFRVEVQDMGIPPLKADGVATVVVNVVRNKNTPRFTNLPAQISTNQTVQTGTRLFVVEGRDDDAKAPFNILKYTIIGDDNAPNFFAINETGQVIIKSDLRAGTKISYSVGVTGLSTAILTLYIYTCVEH